MSAAIATDDPAYRVWRAGGSLQANNPVQRLHVQFSTEGALISAGATRLGLSLHAISDGSSVRTLQATAPYSSANRVGYRYRGISAWYADGPFGLEQGFTAERATGTSGSSPLTLSLGLSGNVRASLDAHAHGMTLYRSGKPVLRYSELRATDARGRGLRTWLTRTRTGIELHVNTSGARYPLTIDPLIQRERFTGTAGTGERRLGDFFGATVALSSNEKTALVGAPFDEHYRGAAYVFTRSGEAWAQQGPKLTGAGERSEHGSAEEAFFGSSVALSADGNTALVGGPANEGIKTYEFAQGVGAAWVFTRSHSTWSQQAMLKPGGAIGEPEFGGSVALSADGNTALIGGPRDNNEHGAAWTFTRTGGTWSEQSKLTGGGEIGEYTSFGEDVALSADGSTAIIGGTGDSSSIGAAWVFTRSGASWSEQAKLTGGGEIGKAEFGAPVAISSDGNTALIGGPRDNNHNEGFGGGRGAAWVFTRSGSIWTEQAKLTGAGQAGESFGNAAALTGDGNTALIGAPEGCGAGTGYVSVFTRSGAIWAEQQKLTGEGEIGPGCFGASIAVSPDANTAVIGAICDGDVPPRGECVGAVSMFTTGVPLAPTVEATAASFPTTTSATVNATVDPERSEVTSCTFEYGTTTAYGNTVPCSTSPGSGSTPAQVSAPLTELAPDTTYHFRLAATNEVGTTEGSDEVFTTPHTTDTGETSESSTPAKAKSEGLSAQATGGTGSVTVGHYAADPVGAPTFLTTGSYSAAWVGPGNSFTNAEFTDCELDGASSIQWWNPNGNGNWQPVSDESGPSGSPGCITVIVNSGTTPSLSELTGAVFGVAVPAGPPPTVTGLSSTKAPAAGGSVVTITGTGFAGVTGVSFGSTPAAHVAFVSNASITATTPAATSGQVLVSVTTVNGTSPPSKKGKFTFDPPTVTRVAPSHGPLAGGTAVTVDGSGFATGSGTTTLDFGKVPATSVECSSSTECTGTAPPGTKAAPVDVVAKVGKDKSKKSPPADRYSYE